jgi:hypothetical protein
MRFGELVRATRLGYGRFEVGEYCAWLRITEDKKGLRLHFCAEVPSDTKGQPSDHYCWWEGTTGEGEKSLALHNMSPFLQKLVKGDLCYQMPFSVVLGEHGKEVLNVD